MYDEANIEIETYQAQAQTCQTELKEKQSDHNEKLLNTVQSFTAEIDHLSQLNHEANIETETWQSEAQTCQAELKEGNH